MKIYYEDNHIIVAYKEKGILSQADGSDKPDMLTILKDYIKEKYNKPGNVYLGLVHRLDINTSGIMVFARTSKAAARLNDAIKNHDFNKKYIATVEGIINNSGGIDITVSDEEHEDTVYTILYTRESFEEGTILQHEYLFVLWNQLPFLMF